MRCIIISCSRPSLHPGYQTVDPKIHLMGIFTDCPRRGDLLYSSQLQLMELLVLISDKVACYVAWSFSLELAQIVHRVTEALWSGPDLVLNLARPLALS